MLPVRTAALAIGCAFGAGHSADWLLSQYLTPAADSAAVNKIYGIQSYGNPASVTSVSVPDDTAHFLRLTAQFASTGTEGYSANLGILHPLNKSWSAVNISATDSIQFEYRYNKKPGGGIEILLASKMYPQFCSDSGFMYLFAPKITQIAPANTWRTLKIAISDFAPPKWWLDRLGGQHPAGYPSLLDVLRNLEAIQFAPKTTYSQPGTQLGVPCTYCVGPNLTDIQFDIRNVKLIGYEDVLPNPDRIGCLEKPVATVDSAIDDNRNELGGYWFAYSDTSTAAAKAGDSARGSSNAVMSLAAGKAALFAGLHKKTGDATFDWRPYAGWAAIGMNFEDSVSTQFAGMTGISFNLQNVLIGPNVKGINFKVSIPGIHEAKTHYAYLPAAKLNDGPICIRPSDLKQPSWVAGAVPFKADSIIQLAWEAKITDQGDATIANDTAVMVLSNIQIHHDTGIVRTTQRAVRSSLGVRYANGILSIQPKAGYENISVVSPSGRTVARLVPGTRSVAVKLERGTWFVVARNAKGEVLSNKFAVMR